MKRKRSRRVTAMIKAHKHEGYALHCSECEEKIATVMHARNLDNHWRCSCQPMIIEDREPIGSLSDRTPPDGHF